jgi:three-Cys-motif partner protein
VVLEFKGDAICLSGLTGTRLKSEVIGEYYPFWWRITSGGKARSYSFRTAIVELNAATGEVHIEGTGETVLGSAGHALELKVNTPNTDNLKIVLVEGNSECYGHLKNVIRRRWPKISIAEAEGPADQNSSNIFLLNKGLDEAVEAIRQLDLGNTIFFFDPLRSVRLNAVEKIARERIRNFYQTGTEILIFLFTSDWFHGRDDFPSLPKSYQESDWTEEERHTVLEADRFFGGRRWRNHVLNKKPIKVRQGTFLRLYRQKLHKWFRYVLTLPFEPKPMQLFHLNLCSNFEIGVRMTRNAFSVKTGNPKYFPDNKSAFHRFREAHRELFSGLEGKERPAEWKTLWKIITNHEGGRCDCRCSDLCETAGDSEIVRRILKWLSSKTYLKKAKTRIAWETEDDIELYRLNWPTTKNVLRVEAPLPLIPLSPKRMRLGKRLGLGEVEK